MKFETIGGKFALVFDEVPAFVFVSTDGADDVRILLRGDEIPIMGGGVSIVSERGKPIEVYEKLNMNTSRSNVQRNVTSKVFEVIK
ncbi:hypothetical protein [Paenibacillus odorifer]|uniref:hypothetical protein n=1 Tax=Paenibacillus odorifer TaxID=189426 RepID=UPI00096E530C|nr:hypothetical protein [Paenibacillus odorifer]OMD07796.1 hypothetical protein BJP50_31435 [Paenibacillus odorifer]